MALDDLVGSTAQNYMPFNPNDPLLFRRLDGPGPNIGGNGLGGYLGDGNHSILQPAQPSVGQYPPSGIASTGQLPQLPQRPHFGNFIGLQPPMLQRPIQQPAMPDYSSQFDKFGETLGGYSSQFDKFGEQLTGLGDQMTGYQDALGSFNEQVGGMGKQFETISNRLDSVDKGLGSLGNQIASLENMQQAQPQQVMQPQRPAFNPFGFGGLGSLFRRRY
jgi:hypothetical protein